MQSVNAEPAGGDAPQLVTYETLDDGCIARVWLNRPQAQNAQSRTLLVQLDEAFGRAEADDQVRVVILAARGKNFSAGHDLGSEEALLERKPGPAQHPTFRSHGATVPAIAERTYLQEWHFFFENTRRWRDLRKITIASVQGNAISAALMLIWACDLIVAADDAKFSDVVGVRMGMPGVEYYAHPWEFGPRKAKELLLTGDSIDAQEAYQLGMVSKVFPRGRRQRRAQTGTQRRAVRTFFTAIEAGRRRASSSTVDGWMTCGQRSRRPQSTCCRRIARGRRAPSWRRWPWDGRSSPQMRRAVARPWGRE